MACTWACIAYGNCTISKVKNTRSKRMRNSWWWPAWWCCFAIAAWLSSRAGQSSRKNIVASCWTASNGTRTWSKMRTASKYRIRAYWFGRAWASDAILARSSSRCFPWKKWHANSFKSIKLNTIGIWHIRAPCSRHPKTFERVGVCVWCSLAFLWILKNIKLNQ